MRGFRVMARPGPPSPQARLAAGRAVRMLGTLAAALAFTAPAAGAAVPGPGQPARAVAEPEPAPCTFARCAPRRGASWSAIASFGGAVALCGWVGRRRR
jgi:hypothetical protein